jgi:hypothetical protein
MPVVVMQLDVGYLDGLHTHAETHVLRTQKWLAPNELSDCYLSKLYTSETDSKPGTKRAKKAEIRIG